MLKKIRKGGLRLAILTVVCAHALSAATSIVGFGPSRINEAKSMVYETERLDALVPSGNRSFRPEAMADASDRATKSGRCGRVVGRCVVRTTPAAPMIPPTKNRAEGGRLRTG